MDRYNGSTIRALLILLLVGIFSRLPFIGAGFGYDADAWRLAETAYQIAFEGRYVVSRVPGHPLLEYIYASIIYLGGSFLTINALSAALSILICLFFYVYWNSVLGKQAFYASLALLLTPGFYCNSVNSMDFIWSLAPAFLSFFYASRGQDIVSALLLALAVGIRSTAALMLIPNLWVLGFVDRRLLKYTVLAGSLALLSYSPVIKEYGISMLYSFPKGYQPPENYGLVHSLEIWGFLGSITLVSLILWSLILGFNKAELRQTYPKRHVQSWIIALSLYFFLYLLAPLEGVYLLCALPFAILLFGCFLKPIALSCLFSMLCFSPFFFTWQSGTTLLYSAGPIFYYAQLQGQNNKLADEVIKKARNLEAQPYMLIAGSYGPLLRVRGRGLLKNVNVVEQATSALMALDTAQRGRIFYLNCLNFSMSPKSAELDWLLKNAEPFPLPKGSLCGES